MSDQWLYRIYGQEFGPVSLDLVRTLVAAGTIAPDDEVRNVTRSNWILACAAAELNAPLHAQEALPEVERRLVRDEWYCRGYAGDYGPLALSDLIQLAAEGELQPDEEIKSRSDDYWKKVCSVRRLVELLPFSDQPRKSTQLKNRFDSDESWNNEAADILPFPGVTSLDRPTDVSTKNDDDDFTQMSYLDEVEHLTDQLLKSMVADNSRSHRTAIEFADIKIAELPTNLPESENAENEQSDLALTDVISRLPEASTRQGVSLETMLHGAISSLQSIVRQFASRFTARSIK